MSIEGQGHFLTLAQGRVHTKIQTGFLAHLSQRLIGELIGYPWSSVPPSVVRQSVVRRPFTMLKDLLLQNCLANQSQILCGASLGRGNDILFAASGSHELIGELIGYPWSGVHPSVRRPSVVSSQCSKIFFSKTAWPIKAKFYVEPPWVGGTIFCSLHLGHMTKMAATPIYGKNPSKIFFSRTGWLIFTKLGM